MALSDGHTSWGTLFISAWRRQGHGWGQTAWQGTRSVWLTHMNASLQRLHLCFWSHHGRLPKFSMSEWALLSPRNRLQEQAAGGAFGGLYEDLQKNGHPVAKFPYHDAYDALVKEGTSTKQGCFGQMKTVLLYVWILGDYDRSMSQTCHWDTNYFQLCKWAIILYKCFSAAVNHAHCVDDSFVICF